MGLSFKETEEFIRIKSRSVTIRIQVASGKDGEYYVSVAPSLLVSGYGNTEEESRESFMHNMELFCQDILNLKSDQRTSYLKKLGFSAQRFKTKNFSKVYIDTNGVLQGFEPSTVKQTTLEGTLAA